jgi:hypothetical protein
VKQPFTFLKDSRWWAFLIAQETTVAFHDQRKFPKCPSSRWLKEVWEKVFVDTGIEDFLLIGKSFPCISGESTGYRVRES